MLLKELTQINGVSGNEENVRSYIKKIVEKYADELRTDSMGNLIAIKKGTSPKYRVMLAAHMDEVGFMVTGYNEDGTIKFSQVGGADPRILPGKRVTIGSSIPGVIGCKPVHLQEKDERSINIKQKDMYIDIGAGKKEEAEKLAPLGEYIAFSSEFASLGKDCIKAKALDDRAGCTVLIEALKGSYTFDLYACFTVQEEVGLRGAETAAYTVKPNLALVLEGTICSDVPGVEEYEYTTRLGAGAALSILDRTSYADKGLVEFIYNTAKENGIPVQFKQPAKGGNDAGKIQLSESGVKIASISLPCRYIHSPVSVMNSRDYESYLNITRLVLSKLSEDQNKIQALLNGCRP